MRRSPRRGAAAIEFALLFPIWVAMVLMIVDWSWYLYCQATLQDITVRAARVGAMQYPTATPSPQSVAQSQALSMLAQAGFDTSQTHITTSIGSSTGGNALVMTIDQPYTPPSHFTQALMSLVIHARGSVHMEYS